MNDKDYIQNKNKLSNLENTYSQGDLETKNPFKKFFQRAGRKMTFWYVNPFGDNQNEFNKAVVEGFNNTNTSLEELNNTVQNLETKLSAVVQQNEALKTRLNKLQQTTQQNDLAIVDSFITAIENTRRDNVQYVDKYIRKINPDIREDASFSDCREISDLLYTDLSASVIKQSENLEGWSKVYRDGIKKQLKNQAVNITKNIIAIVCKRFLESQGIEAVRTEAFELYMMLKKSSVYNVKFVSIEPSLTRPLFIEDIFCIPEQNAGQYMNVINPVLSIFCESTPNIIKSDNCSMILNKSIFKLSGQNPLQGVSESTINELVHLNDFGLHKYLVQSQKAYDILVDKGFHEPTISYPLINKGKIYPRSRVFNKHNFTIGFASSPMEEKQLQDRGINLVCDIVKAMPKIKFEILWRYDTVQVPNTLQSAENCHIITGKYNMKDFYSSIDCVVIPYQSVDSNHACSLSGIEAMQNGIPVLCTDVSGISEVVKYCGMGEISKATVEGITKSIEKIINNYDVYVSAVNQQRLNQKIDNSNLVDIIEREVEKKISAKPITLYEWDRRLRTNNKYLVKGHQQMKEYYQQQEVAEKYTVERFTSKALKCFDYIERQNIDLIIEDRFEGLKPKILDIACGDGRITQECIKYGETTSIDSSQAMLNVIIDRFKDTENKPSTQLCDIISENLEGDFNIITCFRYIRHFEYTTRKILYNKIKEHLTEGGILILDVPNIDFELQLKEATGWQNYNIYDVFWTKENIVEELENNGFRVQYIIPVGQGLMENLPDSARNIPMCWTIGAIKKF